MADLPSWNGADKVYSNAYKMLDVMSKNGHVKTSFGQTGKDQYGNKVFGSGISCYPSEDMNNLIEALNKGDEEKIKGLMLLYRSYGFDKIKGDEK